MAFNNSKNYTDSEKAIEGIDDTLGLTQEQDIYFNKMADTIESIDNSLQEDGRESSDTDSEEARP